LLAMCDAEAVVAITTKHSRNRPPTPVLQSRCTAVGIAAVRTAQTAASDVSVCRRRVRGYPRHQARGCKRQATAKAALCTVVAHLYCSAASAVVAAVRTPRTAASDVPASVVGYSDTLVIKHVVASVKRQCKQHYAR
jgi:hypothetical protein